MLQAPSNVDVVNTHTSMWRKLGIDHSYMTDLQVVNGVGYTASTVSTACTSRGDVLA